MYRNMAHFDVNSGKTYHLLTPDAFEVMKPPEDVSKQLSDAVAEVAKLKQENKSLQKQKNSQAEKMNLPTIQPHDGHFGQGDSILNREYHGPLLPPYTQPQFYMESLVSRQAGEIAELRQKVCQLNADQCIELKLLEDRHQNELQKILDQQRDEMSDLKYCHQEETTKLSQDALLKQRQNENTITSLESELKRNEEMYEAQVAILSRDHQAEVEILQKLSEHLQKEVNELKEINRTKVKQLQENLDDLKKNSESEILQLQQQLSLKTIEAENQLRQIAQLKTYIGESENIPKPVEILKTENNTLKNKLTVCVAEKEHIHSNIELLNIRLSSMTEILALQEAELSQDKHGVRNKEKQENALLKRWREKVFALLVQQKSSRVVLKNDENNWKQKISCLQSQSESAENHIQILCHSLSDKQAQLDISNNNCKRLLEDLLASQQQLDLLINQSTKDREMVSALKDFTSSIVSKFQLQFQHFEAINKQLATFGQRITFAGSRLLLLQNIIAKQKYMSKLHQQGQQLPTEIPVKDNAEESSQQLLDDLVPEYAKTELVRLQKERDLLATQLTEMMEGVEDRFQASETKYKEQESHLKKELLETQDFFQAESAKCQSLSLKFQEMQMRFEEKTNEVESLKMNLSEQEIEAKKTHDELEQKHNEELATQFAEMDRKINDARRQHMKAEISLRQAERQHERLQTCHAEQQKKMKEDFESQTMEIRSQLQTVEAERNLMMATLRQEGLIGKLKLDFLPPQQDVISTANRSDAVTLPEVTSSNLKDKEIPLETLLEDVKQISTALLEDSSDESLP